MRRGVRTAALVFALVWASPTGAEPPHSALQLYAAGQYLAAAEVADDHAEADNLAFAARALLTACITAADDESADALMERAEGLARMALELDPESVDARLQLALVYGMRSQRVSIAEAFARNYAPRGRRLIEEALARAPDDARALALLGAWHLEVLRRGGRAGAFAYGARFTEGAAAFERAMQISPDDPLIPLHFAMALIEIDAAANAARALALLNRVTSLAPRDAFEAYAQLAAEELTHTLTHNGPMAAARLARATRM